MNQTILYMTTSRVNERDFAREKTKADESKRWTVDRF